MAAASINFGLGAADKHSLMHSMSAFAPDRTLPGRLLLTRSGPARVSLPITRYRFEPFQTAGFSAMSDGPFESSTISILIFATGKFAIGGEVIERRHLTMSHT